MGLGQSGLSRFSKLFLLLELSLPRNSPHQSPPRHLIHVLPIYSSRTPPWLMIRVGILGFNMDPVTILSYTVTKVIF